ncbi:methyl-accepting chemotaxis protein [Aureimonas phyllosphaerae]|uniref:Methyl-accepting chemotaxis protein n=1 Tax=Aureimonas phyllosphaerae TaxID=1166078 RepID=A0A7W6BR67_9HYPH|nr:methyl-accepting chemotaxis protein [Aureimonas phyllosphaerae]MBB3936574.1 methyl-accepting chemotaxis protein [Aureimonas phyllosphaerae]MBB3960562.1 methyl-accepting chemotaxis protein [Aureimonas phyllosphaerae]SFF24636.1 methyl-accepting chemotaxis protein [Aureimonas phyllosphaerae]
MLQNTSIFRKFILAIATVSLIGLGLSTYSAIQMNRIGDDYAAIVDVNDPAVVKLARAGRNVSDAAYSAYKVLAYDGRSNEAQAASANFDVKMEATRKFLEEIGASVPVYGAALAEMTADVNEIATKGRDAINLGLQNRGDEDKAVLAAMDGTASQFATRYQDLRDRMLSDNAAHSDVLTAQTWSTIYTTIGLSLAGLLLGMVGAGLMASRGITDPLSRLRGQMDRLAAGDLDVTVSGAERGDEVGAMARTVEVFKQAGLEKLRLSAEADAGRRAQAEQRDRQSAIDSAKAEDLRAFVHHVEAGFARLSRGDLTVRMDQPVAAEFEPIRTQFNQSVVQLEDTIGQVIGAVGAMRSGLSEITIAAGDLSQRTEQQAASLEETVAALGQVTRGVGETAAQADAARQTADIACREAEKGGEVVSRAVAAMSEIEQSSQKIGNIIGVIDEIAFQTNLLALNAGVEAARAGEAGRGFAVVAQEVRGLAQRSAEAAKEIKGLISVSGTQVSSGVELVTASGRSLEAIVSQVGSVARTIADMAGAARDQAVALREVSVAADQMDKVTQQNAAMVEETTAAAQALSSETEQLGGLVAEFVTSGTQGSTGWTAQESSSATSRRPVVPAQTSVRPMPQIRRAGLGSAAAKAAPANDGWEEF